MKHFVQFNLTEDFNRFCGEPPKDLKVEYISRRLPVVIVSGLKDERIPEIEAAYNAKIYQSVQFQPC